MLTSLGGVEGSPESEAAKRLAAQLVSKLIVFIWQSPFGGRTTVKAAAKKFCALSGLIFPNASGNLRGLAVELNMSTKTLKHLAGACAVELFDNGRGRKPNAPIRRGSGYYHPRTEAHRAKTSATMKAHYAKVRQALLAMNTAEPQGVELNGVLTATHD